VLCFCGHVETAMYAPLCYLFDPQNPSKALSPIAFPAGADLFCCHYVQILDGRILAAGGSELHGLTEQGFHDNGSTGSKTIALFDPVNEQWTVSKTGADINELLQGRWYPTLVSLPDGRVAVFSGRRELGATTLIADVLEIMEPPDWNTRELTGANKTLPIYPGLHLAPNGRIYFTHTTWGQEIANPDTASLLIANGAMSASWTNYAGLKPPNPRREEGMSVLLPPAQDGKILVIGGSHALDAVGKGLVEPNGGGTGAFHHIENAVDPFAADILDTNTDPPTWSSVGSMGFGRINGHCVLLPDATVMICGGHNRYKWNPKPTTEPSLSAEIYTPGSGFRTVAAMHDPRMYHSIAILLPDGRVFTAGGADRNQSEPNLSYPPGWLGRRHANASPLNSKTFEFYEPPYMHKGSRPVINDVRRNGVSIRRIEYGQIFTVQTLQSAVIDKVAFVRPGACTHHTDSEQRYVRLNFTKGSGELTVSAVGDARLAPPGYYMLWIIDNQQRPCVEAVFVHLVPRIGQPGGGTSCFIVTATLGSPEHPSVVYLQKLRHELSQGTLIGCWFISAVNYIYESFSPQLARKLSNHEFARTAVREMVVRPIVAVVEKTDCLSQRILSCRYRHIFLVVLFTIEAVLGVVVLPILTIAVFGRIIFARWQEHHAIPTRKE
jgi:Domain of unknown function (DUF1929)